MPTLRDQIIAVAATGTSEGPTIERSKINQAILLDSKGMQDFERDEEIRKVLESIAPDELAYRRERWKRMGFEPVLPGEPEYPAALNRLGNDAPPVIWVTVTDDPGMRVGTMNPEDRNAPISGGVGSRAENLPPNVRVDVINWAEGKGATVGAAGGTIFSGNASGCDRAFERGSLDAGGRVVSWLYGPAGGGRGSNVMKEFAEPVASGRMVFAMAWAPDAHRIKGSPRQRNRYIYCAGLTHVAFCTRYPFRPGFQGHAGGTWDGAGQCATLNLGRINVREPGEQRGMELKSGRYSRWECAHELVDAVNRIRPGTATIDGESESQTETPKGERTERHQGPKP